MIKISELKIHAQNFKGKGISEFIDFIDAEQRKMRKTGVVSLEARESARRLKEIEEKQRERKAFDPEEEFNKL